MKYGLIYLSALMIIAVIASNILVQILINDWLTFAAFTYPVTYLVSEMANYYYGPSYARKIVYRAFLIAFLSSLVLGSFRIACASALAFLISQLLDIYLFTRLRNKYKFWWLAPAASATIASMVDTAIFFSIAFFGQGFLIFTLGLGDLGVKIAMDLALLMPFRIFVLKLPRQNIILNT